MGGKTKKKQARKQAATRTKSNGGRNGVSGHMKKSAFGNGSRASGTGDSTSVTKRSSRNLKNEKSTTMKRKREDDEDVVGNERKEGVDSETDASHVGSSLFTSADDVEEQDCQLKVPDGTVPPSVYESIKKRRKLSVEAPSATKVTAASPFRELLPSMLVSLDEESFSRLLYPNPVCFLTTLNPEENGRGQEVNAGEHLLWNCMPRLDDYFLSSHVIRNLITGLNVMTLSWLTPVNNYGGFAFAIHKTRYSSVNLMAGKKFTLSVPTAHSRELVLAVGRVSGKVAKKFDGSIPNLKAGDFGQLGMASTKGGQSSSGRRVNAFDALMDSDIEDDEVEENLNSTPTKKDSNALTANSSVAHHSFPSPIDGTVAHMHCTMLSFSDAADAGTYLVIAKINKASVHKDYWSHNGKCFVTARAHPTDPTIPLLGESLNSEISSALSLSLCLSPVKALPPILSFLGSQHFGHLVSEED